MKFKLKWAANQFTDIKSYYSHKSVLKSPFKFYVSILLKAFPGLYVKPVKFDFINGYSIKIKDFMAIYIYKEIFIDKCYEISSINNSQPVVIDVGANIGMFMLYMKSVYQDSRIYCFEPFSQNFNTLIEHIRNNSIKDVTPVQKAIFDVRGEKKLFINPKNSGGHSLYSELSGNNYEEVKTITIEDVFKDFNIPYCDLLKLDCEGSEYSIIMSLNNEIVKKIDNIIFEPTTSLYSLNELIIRLKNFGYFISNHAGIIVASKKQLNKYAD